MNRKAELTLMGVLTARSSDCCYSNRKCRSDSDDGSDQTSDGGWTSTENTSFVQWLGLVRVI